MNGKTRWTTKHLVMQWREKRLRGKCHQLWNAKNKWKKFNINFQKWKILRQTYFITYCWRCFTIHPGHVEKTHEEIFIIHLIQMQAKRNDLVAHMGQTFIIFINHILHGNLSNHKKYCVWFSTKQIWMCLDECVPHKTI